MDKYNQIVFKCIKDSINILDSHIYDSSKSKEFYQNIDNSNAEFPVVYVVETDGDYLADLNQENIDFENEVKTSCNFNVVICSGNIDDLINIEEVLTSKFSTPQKLSNVSEDKIVSLATLVYNSDFQAIREKKPNYYKSIIQFNCKDIILPKDIVNPIKIEFDNDIQLRVMKHLALLNELSNKIKKEIVEILNSDILSSFSTTDEKIQNMTDDIKSKYELFVIQQEKLSKQVDKMYTFNNLCKQKISLEDNGFYFCYSVMKSKKCDITTATEYYIEKKKQDLQKQKRIEEAKKREEERLKKVDKMFSKKGDELLVYYTDFVVNDIKSKLKTDFDLPIYGGSTYMEWNRLNQKNALGDQSIVVTTNSWYTDKYKDYTNVAADGSSVSHKYNENALPINFGIIMTVYAKDYSIISAVEKKIQSLYSEERQIDVPDPVFNNEIRPIKIVLDHNELFNEKTLSDNRRSATITFKAFPSVYYVKDYNIDDYKDNQRLQFRQIQQVEFLVICDSNLRTAQAQLEYKYKPLFVIEQKPAQPASWIWTRTTPSPTRRC